MFACLYAPGNVPLLIECAGYFSPWIEQISDAVVFDIRGLGIASTSAPSVPASGAPIVAVVMVISSLLRRWRASACRVSWRGDHRATCGLTNLLVAQANVRRNAGGRAAHRAEAPACRRYNA